jgi:hypothetical protein
MSIFHFSDYNSLRIIAVGMILKGQQAVSTRIMSLECGEYVHPAVN